MTAQSARPLCPDLSAARAALSAGNPALALESLLSQAMAARRRSAGRGELALGSDLSAFGAEVQAHVAATVPISDAIIGFDRPTNLYIVTELYQAGGHRVLLEQLIRARPDERHLVLFTGTFERTRDFSLKAVEAMGGYGLQPDADLGLYDKWLWLREKLAAMAARRVWVLAHPEDVVAAMAAGEVAPRYGRRLYLLHHADTVGGLGVIGAARVETMVTHLAIRPEQRDRLRAAMPEALVLLLPLPNPTPKNLRPRRLPPASASGAFRPQVTATAGNPDKFSGKGDMAFGAVIARVLSGTGGVHLHLGPKPDDFVATAKKHLLEAGLNPDRLQFLGEVPSVAEVLVDKKVDAFIASFPVGGALTLLEAAAAGVPLVVQAGPAHEDPAQSYVSGQGFHPDEILRWQDPDGLETLMRQWCPREEILRLVRQAGVWLDHKHRPKRFVRRVEAILSVAEGRRRNPLGDPELRRAHLGRVFDAQHYLTMNPDVAATGINPFDHYLRHGEAENRLPSPLFDPQFYLDSLPAPERARARAFPFSHYLARGEALGYRPHPFFDPAVAELSLRRKDPGMLAWKPSTASIAEHPEGHSVLATYLASPTRIVPHALFDPDFYVRQLPFPPEGKPLLVHFLAPHGREIFSPHPLIDSRRLFEALGRPAGGWLRGLLDWLQQAAPKADEPSTHMLFDPNWFLTQGHKDAAYLQTRQKVAAQLAPNLLWLHLIEGNCRKADTHLLVSITEIARQLPATLTQAGSVLVALAQNRLGADTHPLVSNRHIEAQAPWLRDGSKSAVHYYLEHGARDTIDPHPWFSTQFYLYHNPDLAKLKVCPLVHYLVHGQYEGRLPSAFFDGNAYYQTHLKAQGGGQPLLHYAQQGAAHFLAVQPQNTDLRRLAVKTASGLVEDAPIGAPTGGRGQARAADMLTEALHPETAPPHPTLLCETRRLATTLPPAIKATVIWPETRVLYARPAVSAAQHIAPPGGDYAAPEGLAAEIADALVVPGNDGFGLRAALTQGGADEAVWYDPGLAEFDAETMFPKENTSLVAFGRDAVLLRRHDPELTVPAGIFCSGSYSHNYYHFLIETLPRALLAARLAPAGTPILADDAMPAQHYQALRLMLPGNPVIRLRRMHSYRVGRLYAGSMPSVVQDAIGPETPPVAALMLHPTAIAALSRLGDALDDGQPDSHEAKDGDRRKPSFLWRSSEVRRFLNQHEIHKALGEAGFEGVSCQNFSFADQVRLMRRSPIVVGQSGAQLVNMVFTRPGTRVYPIWSNAPGANFALWSLLGAMAGQSVVNLVGWQITGTAGPGRPAIHNDFTLPASRILPFVQKPTLSAEGGASLDTGPEDSLAALEEVKAALETLDLAGTEADVLTGAWSVLAQPGPDGFDDRLLDARAKATRALALVDGPGLMELVDHPFLKNFGLSIRSGFPTLPATDSDLKPQAEIRDGFARLAEQGATAQEFAAFPRLLILAMLHLPAWKLPLVAQPERLDPKVLDRYLAWISLPPFLSRAGEDLAWVNAVERLLNWIADQIDRNLSGVQDPDLQMALGRMAVGLDLGQLLLIEAPLPRVMAARNRLLSRIALTDGTARPTPRQSNKGAPGPEGRIRVGILCRTFDKGPDSEAVVAFCKGLNRERYEVFAYSVGFRDRVVSADASFARAFDAVISHRRLLSSDPADIRATLIGDQLDVFLHANATTYGIRPTDIALYHRVAPRQAVLNSHLPQPMGYPSFDAFITGKSDDPMAELDQADYAERLVRLPGPVIGYLTSLSPKERPPLTRETLGLSADDVVLMNAGSLSKLRHDCLLTMMKAAAAVPKGRLLLAPYNPGWVGRSQAFAFNRQLAETAAIAGLPMDRITVTGELSVAEAEAALQLADVYLTPFPHGGATMVHLALIYGVPPVVLRRRSARSIDQFLVGSLGFSQLLASTPEQYVALAAKLGTETRWRKDLSKNIAQAARKPVFVDSQAYAKDMEAAVADLILQPPRT